MRIYQKGDLVKVWSLQSFHGGGFIDGRIGVVRQKQTGQSVIVHVHRSGVPLTDSYEVYAQQLELVEAVENIQFTKPILTPRQEIEQLRTELLANKCIQ